MYFLANHSFDFNKLFNEAINYERESEFSELKERSVHDVLKSHPSKRQYSALSVQNAKQLIELMAKVDDFVYDKASKQTVDLDIASNSLKKALSKKVKEKYTGCGIFVNYQRKAGTKTEIKKTKGFK